MNLSQLANTRYSCKAFQAQRALSEAQLDALRQAVQLAPSSINSQPWLVYEATSDQGKAVIAAGMPGDHYAYNAQKVLTCSFAAVLCTRIDMDDQHLSALLERERADGRINSQEAFDKQRDTRLYYIGLHRQAGDVAAWLERQTYIALGNLLLQAQALGLNACPIEGFDSDALSRALGLDSSVRPSVVVAIGYRSDDDFNHALPKSRLPLTDIFRSLD